MILGYTTGVFDLFHIGHLNLLKNARGLCDKLIVGVSTDEIVAKKFKKSVIPFEERLEIVRSIKYVDAAIPQKTTNKFEEWQKIHFNILFVGDDWYKTERWKIFEEQFKEVGVRIVYFPRTKGTSSTLINQTLLRLRSNNSMVDKNLCMSSYLAFRYLEKDDVDFFEGLHHKNFLNPTPKNKIEVSTAKEIDAALKEIFSKLRGKKLGLMLSGGMDSAVLASYMSGCDAYTFRFLNGNFQTEELNRAEFYAKTYGLNLHYVDINWQAIEPHIDKLMKNKCAPVHSIEPQIFLAVTQAKNDGVEIIVTGNGSDKVFGGLDKILSQDWKFDDFAKWYIFLDPSEVLENPADICYVFERYRRGDKIDFMKFIDEVYAAQDNGSYNNAFETASINVVNPYAELKLGVPLDLKRIRSGESKYLIRELFKLKYPNYPVPEKIPMPRPVDFYFENWQGPTRPEFKKNLDMKKFSGNQKWQLYCLERFLNLFEQ